MKKRIIISGGGTGGHIFPAIAIANALKEKEKDIEILFVGAKGRLEMEKVPAAGYEIEPLPIQGFARRLTLKNLSFFFKLLISLKKSFGILKRFKPHAAVGVGGYASGPLLYAATRRKIPALIQEQNSFPGITNKLLGKNVDKICIAYEKMSRFFPENKLILTGNPVRKSLLNTAISKQEAKKYFGLKEKSFSVFFFGGSGGARTINHSLLKTLDKVSENSDIEFVLQHGKYYEPEIQEALKGQKPDNLKTMAFIDRMDMAYQAADLVVARAGAGTIAELCLLGKASLLVPSPNVAEDHQTKNAMALAEKGAAIVIPDNQAVEKLLETAAQTVKNKEKTSEMEQNARLLAKPDADKHIAQEILNLIEKNTITPRTNPKKT